MSISTYAELQTAVAGWLHRSNLTSNIPDFITLGEGRVYRNVRCRQMEASLNGSTLGGTVALPTDYVALKNAFTLVTLNKVNSLKRKSMEWIIDNNPNMVPGTPKFIARNETDFVLSPVPVDGTALVGTYYKRFATLSTALNALFLSTPGLWLFASLIESAPFLKNDARVNLWEAKFGQLVKEVNAEEYLENDSGSTLQMTAESMSHP